MTRQEAAELAKVLVPEVYLQNDTEGYGYPEGKPRLQNQHAAGVGAGDHECAVLPVQSRAGLPGRVAGDACSGFRSSRSFTRAWAR